jgi:hypothetical protein
MEQQMSNPKTQITCPNCGHRFYAEEALEKQLLAKLEQDYQQKAARQVEILNQQRAVLEQEKQKLAKQLLDQDQLIKHKVEQEKKQLFDMARVKAEESVAQRLKALEEENKARREENLKLQKMEVELLTRENQLKEEQERMQIEIDKRLLEKQSTIEAKVRAAEVEKSELRFKEYEKKLQDQRKLVEEMKRRAEQGSMQMQGEVQELALEDFLKRHFPFDQIAQVPKGVRGADVVQIVIDSLQRQCGKIIFESKRTKAFSNDWISKLKADQIEQGAELAVIVTEAMPSDMTRFGEKEGVWICSFPEVKSLAFVLREMLLRTQSVKVAQENKGDKMEMIYRYLTGVEFKQRVEAIVDGFSELRTELDRERNAMQRLWKMREKQIEKIINNTIDMYGSVKGIAGSSIENIPSLELPQPDENEGNDEDQG